MNPESDRLQALVQDLQLHQHELEAQNQALQQAQQDIDQARESYTVLYDTAPVAYFTVDRNTVIQLVNLTACHLLQQDREALLARPLAPYVVRADRTAFRQHILGCLRDGEQRVMEGTLSRAGRIVQISSRPAPDRPGSVLTTMMDISELRAVQGALAQTTASHHALLQAASEATLVVAGDVIESCNHAAVPMFGPALAGRRLAHIIQEGPDQKPVGVGPDGVLFPVEMSRAHLPGVNRAVVIVRDLTEQRRLEEKLLAAVESQRTQLGRDLHDGVSQNLSGVIMLAQTLEHTISGGGTPDVELARRVVHLLQRTLQQTQDLARGHYLATLSKHGFPQALRELARECADMFGRHCIVSARAIPVPNPTMAINLYRFAQEAINNAMKHGNPSVVRVRWETQGSRVRLEIMDDGHGFVPEQVVAGLGLGIMVHRVTLMRAAFQLESGPGAGCRVACTLPRRQLEVTPPSRAPVTSRPTS